MFAPANLDRRFRGMRQQSAAYNLPAPTGGLNARDAYTDMDPLDAIVLTNVFPEANYDIVRNGYASWATGLGGPVRSLLTWNGLTGLDKIFGGAGSNIWDVSSSGAASAVVTGFTNVDFQWTNIKTAGGLYLIYVNGADPTGAFDGTTWTEPAITVADSSTFVNVCQFKERLWFAVKDSLDLYYLGLQSIAGAAVLFPLGSVFRRGGFVIGLGTFSNDAGEGPDDFFVIVTSNGEIAVYQGTDPSSANTWTLVGRFDVGMPLGRRCTVRWNGDLGIITQDGVVSMQAALRFDRASIQKATITGKIQTLFGQYASSYKNNFGWSPCLYPRSRYLIINVPTVTNTTQVQLVMNTITGAWCQFENMNAGCWGVANDLLYFGGNDGVVYQADDGQFDMSGPINWAVQTSWQMPGGAQNKFFKMVRPVMITGGGVSFRIGTHVDFDSTTPSGAVPVTPITGAVWPMTWPWTWGGQNLIDQRWQSVGAIGTWVSLHLEGASNGGSCQINNFEILAERGGVL